MAWFRCLYDQSHLFEAYPCRRRKFCSQRCLKKYISEQRADPEFIKQRFWSFVTITGKDKCWLYNGPTHDKHGYKKFVYTRQEGRTKSILAHQFAFRITKGKIPKGMCVCHTCDNPPCVNPRHLFLGTHYDNVLDKVKKGRQQRGEMVVAGKLTEKDVVSIIRLLKEGLSRTKIAANFAVRPQSIDAIANGKNWKHIDRSSI